MKQLTPILELKNHTFYSCENEHHTSIVEITYCNGKPLNICIKGQGANILSDFFDYLDLLIAVRLDVEKIMLRDAIHEIADVELFNKWLKEEEKKGNNFMFIKQALFYYEERQNKI